MNKEYGAIAGDVLGSKYEKFDISLYKFDKPSDIDIFSDDLYFTDDTIHTVAMMDAILNSGEYYFTLLKWSKKYPRCGFSKRIRTWIYDGILNPEEGYGNGAAMRISPLALANVSREQVYNSTIVTHNTKQAIKSAYQTFDLCIDPEPYCYCDYEVKTLSEIKKTHEFSSSAEKTMPVAIACFKEAHDFESCIQNAIWVGGDVDTIAAIAGSIAACKWGVPDKIVSFVKRRLTLEIQEIIDRFSAKVETLRT